MKESDLGKLREDILEQASVGVEDFGLIGRSVLGVELVAWLRATLPACRVRWYSDEPIAKLTGHSAPLRELVTDAPPVVVVIDDAEKIATIKSAVDDVAYAPKLIVAGYAHHDFNDPAFEALLGDMLVPPIANGYPNTLVHIYQCLVNAARLELDGAVVEFGVFKGGTTMFLAKAVRALDRAWPVVGFDTFGGFPPKRTALDMYDHPGAEFHDFAAVAHYLGPVGVQLIQGDIVETAAQLGDHPIVLAFIDTDNHASASAAIAAVKENVVVGGAIVFDHFTGVDRFRYTLGEKIAAGVLESDDRYFNLHATGVFLRQK
mgnify:CR=1 FL=1